MLRVNFKVVRNGLTLIDAVGVTYYNFADAAKAISNDVEELSNSKEGYFSQFNKKPNEYGNDHKFGWICDWNSISEIISYGCFEMWENGKSGINSVSWKIVADTSDKITDKELALKMP